MVKVDCQTNARCELAIADKWGQDQRDHRIQANGINCESVWQRFLTPLRTLAGRYLDKRLSPKVDADDVVQSVLLSFVSRLNSGRIRIDSSQALRGLLALMVTRKCSRYVGHYRRGRRNLKREMRFDSQESLENDLTARDSAPESRLVFDEQLDQLLSKFDQQDRQIVNLLLDGQSTAQIAQQLGCSRRTIQRTVQRVTAAIEVSFSN